MDRRVLRGGMASPDDEQCERMRPLLSLMADGMASPEETRILELHLAGCPDCRSSYEWMLATRQVLANRPAAVPPGDMSLRIRAALANERSVEARRAVRFRTVYQPAFAMAAAAVVAALFVSVFHHSSNRLTTHPITVAVQPNASEQPGQTETHPVLPIPAGGGSHAVKTAPRVKMHPIRRPDMDHLAGVTPSDKPLKLVVPPPHVPAAVNVAKLHPVTPHVPVIPKHNDQIAKLPVEHTSPTPPAPVNSHSDVNVATNKVPDTNPVTPTPQPPVTVPNTAPEPHTVVVASAGGGNSLLASVREHLDHMPRAISTQSERITHGSGVHMADYTTPTETANLAESESKTASFVASDYK